MRNILGVAVAIASTAVAGSAWAHNAPAHHGHGTHHAPAADVSALPSSEAVRVEGCWIRLLPAPAPSAGYFVVKNEGDHPVKLTGASTKAFESTMLHETTHEGGMSRMSMTHDVEIAAGQELVFKPGGYHAMLEEPADDVKVGATLPVAFIFDGKEKVEAQCEVKPANTIAP